MGKGKGRQAGAFGSKKLRASFNLEWQTRAAEVPLRRRRVNQQHDSKTATSAAIRERPKLRVTQLRGLLQEREYHDRIENQAERRRKQQQQQNSVFSSLVAPGEIVYGFDQEYRERLEHPSSNVVPSLVSLCLQTLIPVLPLYLESLGRDELRDFLSLLPAATLTCLSVLVSQQGDYELSNDLLYCICHHVQVKGICIWGRTSTTSNSRLEDDDTTITDEGLLSLLPSNNGKNTWFPHVPDSWEDYDDEVANQNAVLLDDFPLWQGCLMLERVELCCLLHVSGDAVLRFLQKCPLITHLSLSSSLGYDSGPDIVLQLHEILPQLSILEVSGCVWVTEGLLRRVWQQYEEANLRRPVIRARHCFTPTESVTLELDYPEHYWRDDRTATMKRTGGNRSVGVGRTC